MGKYTKEDIIRMVREGDVEFIRMQFTRQLTLGFCMTLYSVGCTLTFCARIYAKLAPQGISRKMPLSVKELTLEPSY